MKSLQVAKAIRQKDKTWPLIAHTGLALNVEPREELEAKFNKMRTFAKDFWHYNCNFLPRKEK
jgi:hypothetical protein